MSQFVAKKLQEAMNGTLQGASELKALLCALETTGRDLLAWDAKYPKGTIYNVGEHTACETELTAIVERFRELLAHNRY